MTQWGKTDLANNSPVWAAQTINAGSGKAAKAANNTALYNNVTPGAFVSRQGQAIGTFAVSKTELANTTSSESAKAKRPGWHMRRAGEGGIASFSVAAGADGGANFANGESVLVSNGSANAVGIITTNATSNMVSIAVSGSAGKFSNAGSVTFGYRREKHLTVINVTGGSGYDNTDVLVVSNGTVNATATLTTNAAGKFGNSDIVITAVGLFPNTLANTGVVVTVLAANGAASNGSGATLTANINPSTGGTATVTLGGRAGRVHYECLVAFKSTSDDGTSDDTFLPQ